jgi:hypothetical protein
MRPRCFTRGPRRPRGLLLILAVAGMLAAPLSPLVPHPVHADSSVTVSAVNGTFYANRSYYGSSFDDSLLSHPTFTQSFPVVDLSVDPNPFEFEP